MTVTAAQQSAFTGATLGVGMADFQLTILLIFFSILYIWASWVVVTQWKAWGNQQINFYAFLTRTVRAVLVTVFVGFLLV